tara:strand:- start:45 stop:1190 length:1146 start_codon:yes stop_codon:yes gene_type:complete
MALTKIPIELSSTPSIVDGGNATAITIDSNEGVAFSKDISTSTAGTSNFRAGVNAGNSIASGGNYNVVVGDEAGTAITTGDYNVALGYNAGGSVTTGVNNTLVGGLSGDAITTGQYNTLYGYRSGTGITDAEYNVGLGGDALFTNTTGDNNTAVGQAALYSNTTANNNTAVGRSALLANTTGTGNTALGYAAGDALTTGTNNTVIGNASAAGSVSAANRIVLGWTTVGTGNAHFTFGQGAGSDRVYNSFQSNASWTRVSDQRYKEEVVNNTDCGLSFINALRPVTFKFKALSNIDSSLPDYDEDATSRNYDNKMYGLIAQEVKQAMDDNNITDFGGWDVDEASGIQAISQEMFVHPLIKAVQDLSAQLDAALARIETLEGA